MKKTFKIAFIAISFVGLISSCSVSGPLLITDNDGGSSSKRGETSYSVILGIIKPMNADASIATAAKNAGITKVSTVDLKVTGGLFKTTYTTVVTGE